MKTNSLLKLIVPSVLLGMVVSVPAFAQNGNAPASQSMHQAGQKVEQAGSDTGAAAKDAYHGAKRAIEDTKITTEIEAALVRDRSVSPSAIHVSTTAGVVTLKGNVPSPEMAQHAAQLAEQTEGVKSVNNQLMVVSSESVD